MNTLKYYQDKYIKAPVTEFTLARVESEIDDLRNEVLRGDENSESYELLDCFNFLIATQNTIIDNLIRHNPTPQHEEFRNDLHNRRLKLNLATASNIGEKVKINVTLNFDYDNYTNEK